MKKIKKIKNLDTYLELMSDICVYDEYALGKLMKRLFFLFYPELKPQLTNRKKDFTDHFGELFQHFMLGFIPIESIDFKHNYQTEKRVVGKRTLILINYGFGFIDEYLKEFEVSQGNKESADKYFHQVLLSPDSTKQDLMRAYNYKERARENSLDILNIKEVN